MIHPAFRWDAESSSLQPAESMSAQLTDHPNMSSFVPPGRSEEVCDSVLCRRVGNSFTMCFMPKCPHPTRRHSEI